MLPPTSTLKLARKVLLNPTMALSKVDGCLCSGRAVVDHDMSGLEAGLDMVVAMIGAEAYV